MSGRNFCEDFHITVTSSSLISMLIDPQKNILYLCEKVLVFPKILYCHYIIFCGFFEIEVHRGREVYSLFI